MEINYFISLIIGYITITIKTYILTFWSADWLSLSSDVWLRNQILKVVSHIADSISWLLPDLDYFQIMKFLTFAFWSALNVADVI